MKNFKSLTLGGIALLLIVSIFSCESCELYTSTDTEKLAEEIAKIEHPIDQLHNVITAGRYCEFSYVVVDEMPFAHSTLSRFKLKRKDVIHATLALYAFGSTGCVEPGEEVNVVYLHSGSTDGGDKMMYAIKKE